jgi:hypothetical protein
MTAIKINTEHKTILDFSNRKVSKNLIAQTIKNTEFLEFKYNDRRDSRTYLRYNIKVGMYQVYVDLTPTSSCAKRLKEYGSFCIKVYSGTKEINLKKDPRFKSQHWVNLNDQYQLKTHNLVEAIMHCARLDSLKAFL